MRRLRGKAGPRDTGDEAGQAGAKARLGWSQRFGQSAGEVHGQYGTGLDPAAPRATALPAQPHPSMGDATGTPKPSRFPAQVIPRL